MVVREWFRCQTRMRLNGFFKSFIIVQNGFVWSLLELLNLCPVYNLGGKLSLSNFWLIPCIQCEFVVQNPLRGVSILLSFFIPLLSDGFSDGSVGKESSCSVGDTGDMGSIPGLGRSPWRRQRQTHSSILAWKIPWTEEPKAVHGVARSQTWLSD